MIGGPYTAAGILAGERRARLADHDFGPIPHRARPRGRCGSSVVPMPGTGYATARRGGSRGYYSQWSGFEPQACLGLSHGGKGGSRTLGRLIISQMLYPLSYFPRFEVPSSARYTPCDDERWRAGPAFEPEPLCGDRAASNLAGGDFKIFPPDARQQKTPEGLPPTGVRYARSEGRLARTSRACILVRSASNPSWARKDALSALADRRWMRD